jgi:hypothetical protein
MQPWLHLFVNVVEHCIVGYVGSYDTKDRNDRQ